MSTPESKPGFLSAGLNALSPWGSRSATPKPPHTDDDEKDKTAPAAIGAQRGGDHTINRRHRLSLRKYPNDCPPLVVRWFHAVDIPKRKPFPSSNATPSPDKPVPKPKKFIPFSPGDSRAIENAFQKLADEADTSESRRDLLSPLSPAAQNLAPSPETSTKVSVNEDYLFDVEIETRELAPAYWPGPVYEVKRGTWFTAEGEPVDENLATQLEEGYLKVKPWRFTKLAEKRSASQPRTRPVSLNVKAGDDYRKLLNQRDSTSNPVTPKSSFDDLREKANSDRVDENITTEKPTASSTPEDSPRTYRLFGAHMNSVVTYQDEMAAWLLTDDFLTRMGSTLYSRFAGGGHFAGMKYIRGFVDPARKRDPKPKDDKMEREEKDKKDKKAAGRPVTPSLAYGEDPGKQPQTPSSEPTSEDERADSPSEARRKTLERHMSSLMTSSQPEDSEKQEEEIRKRDEKEMREDYKDQSKDEQGREIEHLLLVTHGIGQRLGMRLESVNFVHDVNTMRKSLKAIYANSPDLQALNSEVEKETKNSRIQVLPICWRHLLDFPKQSLKHNRKEHDLGDIDFEDHEYPNLDDITVEGVPAVRNLITDLALDILLYQSPAYKGHISRIVLQECNRIYRLFKERNPSFKGKVTLVGHSLGSAIMFDILCQQKDKNSRPSQSSKHRRATEESLKLDFPVEDFYALGSPIGLFQMLKGRTIAARPSSSSFVLPETPASPLEDPFSPDPHSQIPNERAFDITVSSPAVKQIFNIFHPTDPISYRLEPLISPAMSALKPQPLPYTKKGIFGAPAAQGLTGIGARVGQGMTEFWTSVSSGIASGILNRSLGITGVDAGRMREDLTGQKSSRPLSVGAGTNVAAGVIPGPGAGMGIGGEDGGPARGGFNEERKRRLGEEVIATGEVGEHPPTLIDAEIETLFAGFQKRRKSRENVGDGGGGSKGGEEERDMERDLEWQDLEERSRKLRKEEAKVRALNANGRVDYSIQEGAFDISLLASIASHLSYWADEDVAHFMISQLLARHRVFKSSNGKDDAEGI
ncbi:DDHD-domain-containing protein [Lindgomyces ingoldianus]|uniref:DDHD-domain-containing protein n=1 Tax=Lindgomyces ingoldianus TaxID=673940 RepID=A0ACB6RG91_9PLEO|nr:DDHD-domain-containing protein [Lindgomyces ingoldianus]KAF2478338.1 DDHD-domain-containing protein [Lindgomyces ingoldianus]